MKKKFSLSIDDIKNLTIEQEVIILTYYLQTKDKNKASKDLKVDLEVIEQVITKYWFILQDIINDEDIEKIIKEKYKKSTEDSLYVSNKILELYRYQVDKIYKLYIEDGNGKLMNEFIMKCLSDINKEVQTIINNQRKYIVDNRALLYSQASANKNLNVKLGLEDNNNEYGQNTEAVYKLLSKCNEERSIKVKVTDHQTLEEIIYGSKLEASKQTGIPMSHLRTVLDSGKLYKERYLFETYIPEKDNLVK